MGVSILPYEISKYLVLTENNINIKTNKFLLAIQFIFYYFTLIISFFVNPYLIAFKKVSQQPNQSLNSRLIKAFKNVLFYYLVIGFLVLIGFSILLIFGMKLNISLILGLLPSILNLYGLVMFLITIGVAILKIPISIWHKADPANILRDYLLLIDNFSQDKTDDSDDSDNESNHASYYNSLLEESKKQYENIIELELKRNPKHIALKYLRRFASILSGLLILVYIFIDCSYAFRDDRKNYILYKVLIKINNQVLKQLFLFIFIGLYVSVGAHMLTYINIGALFPKVVRNILSLIFNIVDYKFVKHETTTKTFQYWSTYLQRLVPTIAYHCQRLAGAEQSSLERIMGQLDQFYALSKFMRITFPPLLLVVVVIYFISIMDETPDTQKLQNGLMKFKRQMIRESGISGLDQYIIYDVLERDLIIKQTSEANNDLSIQLDSTSSFHDPQVENPNNNPVS